MTADKVKSAARVFEILEFFASHRQPARLHELGAALGYPVSSLTALLRTMLDMGYMTLDPATHAYLPAPRLQTLTGWMQVDDYEQTVLFDALCRLREAAGEPVVLAAPADLHVDYVTSLHRQEGRNTHIRAGDRRLMVQNGTGWLMLARAPRPVALQIYRRTVAEGLISPRDYPQAAFEAVLDANRDTDVSILHARDLLDIPTHRTVHWDASMMSTLIPVPPGHARPLGIGIHGPTERISRRADELSELLRQTSAELAARLETV